VSREKEMEREQNARRVVSTGHVDVEGRLVGDLVLGEDGVEGPAEEGEVSLEKD
jgi:hypothetical protein